MSSEKQSRVLKGEPHIVVATPGRLWDLLNSNEPHLADVENIRYCQHIILMFYFPIFIISQSK